MAPTAESTTDTRVRIPGWDSANDVNGDGYVSDAEASSLANPSCTARFRYESRALPWGRMWSPASSWCRIEPSNERLTTWLAEYLNQTWHAQGMGGAYNDDLLKLMGPAEYNVVSGGSLEGYTFRANSSDLVVPYQTAFAAMLERIRTLTRKWIAANISARNMFMAAATRVYLYTLSFLLREDYITSATGLTGYFGHLKAWDVAAAGYLGIRSLLQCQLRHGPILYRGVANRSDWEYEQESCAAQYYLLHLPGLTYLNVWGNRYWYGSGNTWYTGEAGNWWEAGVPMNVAYQPTGLLQADIGIPEPDDAVAILPDEEPIRYMVRTEAPLSDYTLVGWSNETRLAHAELNETGELMTIRSNIYYAQREPDAPSIAGAPQSPSSHAASPRASCCTARASLGARGFPGHPIRSHPAARLVQARVASRGPHHPRRARDRDPTAWLRGCCPVKVSPPSPAAPPASPPSPRPPPSNPPTPAPPSPAAANDTTAQLSHEVVVEVIAVGAPEDYGAAERRELAEAFARLTDRPASRVSLTIEAASVLIRAVIAVESSDAAAEVSTGLATNLSDASSSSALLVFRSRAHRLSRREAPAPGTQPPDSERARRSLGG